MDEQQDLAPASINETARIFGVSPFTVRAWLAQRRLGFLKLGRAVRIPRSEIQRVLQQAFVPPRADALKTIIDPRSASGVRE